MKKGLIKFGSILLLLIFSAIQVLPALHSHAELASSSEASVNKKRSSSSELDVYSGDCLICSFIAHSQSNFPVDFAVSVVRFFITAPIILGGDHSRQFFEIAVLTWTNKGPPTL